MLAARQVDIYLCESSWTCLYFYHGFILLYYKHLECFNEDEDQLVENYKVYKCGEIFVKQMRGSDEVCLTTNIDIHI